MWLYFTRRWYKKRHTPSYYRLLSGWNCAAGSGWLGHRRTSVSKRRRPSSVARRALPRLLRPRQTKKRDDHVAERSVVAVSNSASAAAVSCSHLLPLQPGSYVCQLLCAISYKFQCARFKLTTPFHKSNPNVFAISLKVIHTFLWNLAGSCNN